MSLSGERGTSANTRFAQQSRLLANRMRREAEILAHLSNTAEPIPQIAAAVYRKTDPHIAWAAARNVAAHLEKLLSEGRVMRDGEIWRGVE